ncbi:ribbon-helix-helix protein, CopG family, partial [Candidatus Bathyarchaeota archaeon]|nr:ribbon-helix-helix protein, CopG family [Candidatus Bathyarchaeota archaeon]
IIKEKRKCQFVTRRKEVSHFSPTPLILDPNYDAGSRRCKQKLDQPEAVPARRENKRARNSSLSMKAKSRILTYSHIWYMVIWMKTTLNINDPVMALLKQEAARRGCTMSELMESALRLLLTAKGGPRSMPPLPSFKSGGAMIEIADREALYEAMEGR